MSQQMFHNTSDQRNVGKMTEGLCIKVIFTESTELTIQEITTNSTIILNPPKTR